MNNIIAEDNNCMIVRDKKGGVTTIPNDVYNQVKYKQFNGNRILFKFTNGDRIEETYDDRIFNCYYDAVTQTGRNSNALCDCIPTDNFAVFRALLMQDHFEEQEQTYMSDYFKGWKERVEIKEAINKDLIKSNYHNYTKAYIPKYHYIVDGIFLVDDKGTSFILDPKNERGESQRIDNKWSFICTVARTNLGNRSVNTKLGTLTLSVTMQEVISKVLFFLQPNMKDRVFTQQTKQVPKIHRLLMDEYNESMLRSNVGSES